MESREELNKRIAKIKGQVEGIERMINTNRDTLDIVQQIVAVNSALKKVSIELLKSETSTCVTDQKKFEYLLNSIFKLK
jgi:DNA-binding FrmR family transcriptional regulator